MNENKLTPAMRTAIVKATNDGKLEWRAAFKEQAMQRPKKGAKKPTLAEMFDEESDETLLKLQAEAEISIEGRKFLLGLKAINVAVKDGKVMPPPAEQRGEQDLMAMLMQGGMGAPPQLEFIATSDDTTWAITTRGKELCDIATAVLAYAKRKAPQHAAAFDGWVERVVHGPQS